MLKRKCHLLFLSVHLLQWFSASSPSSTPLWTTLSKFTMGRLSIPVFSAPSPVHTQVRLHKISFWCRLQVSNCYIVIITKLYLRIWAFCFFSLILLETNGSHRPSCRACRLAPVICKTIQHWRQQFPWHICSLKKYRNITYEKEKHKTVWPNKPLDFIYNHWIPKKCCCLNSTFTSLYFCLRKSWMKFKIAHETFPPNIMEYGSKEPKYTNSGNTVHITAQINGNKWHQCDRQKMWGLVKLCECRAVVHLRLPQLSGLTKAKWWLWFVSRAALEIPVLQLDKQGAM